MVRGVQRPRLQVKECRALHFSLVALQVGVGFTYGAGGGLRQSASH